MTEIKTETTRDEFVTKDRADYYSGITRSMVNGKNAYELKGKFLDDLLSNAFIGTNEEDTLEMQANGQITVTKVIRDPSNSTFASKFANHMMMDPFTKKVLWDFWKKSDDQDGVIDKGFTDVEEANNDDEQETAEIFRIETNFFDYETPLCTKCKEFSFLLNIDPDLFTPKTERAKTYEDFVLT
ncbi:hypothetical protein Tco_0213190 [Tanacetum coccineum]